MPSFVLRSPPFGSGTASGRRFKDGNHATPYQQNFIVTLGVDVLYDPAAVQDFCRTNFGVYPGVQWHSAAPVAGKGKYHVGRIAYSHSVVQDDNGDALQWNAIVYVEPNPIELEAEVDFQTSHYQETVTKNQKDGTPPNKAGTPIVNPAGDPFAKAMEENKGHLRFEVSRAFDPATFDAARLKSALYHKSASATAFNWLGVPYFYLANQLYCTDVRMQFKWEPLPHFAVTMAFEVDDGMDNPGTSEFGRKYWVRHPIAKGYRHRDRNNPTGPPINFVSGKGVLHGGEGLLDYDGYDLTQGTNIPPIVMDIESIPEFEFNLLNIFPGQ